MSLTANEQWKKIDDGGKGKSNGEGMTFRLPPDLIDQKVQGIDSSVGQYKSDSIILSFDYGMYSDPLTSYSKRPDYQESEIKIDGRVAKKIIYKDDAVKGFAYVVGLHVSNTTKTKLTMMAYCKDKKDIKIVEEIFTTVKFLKKPEESILKLFGGKENFEIVQKYEKVTAHRVTPVLKKGDKETILSSAVLSNTQADKLVELLNDKNNVYDSSKLCSPIAGVLLTFEKGDKKMNLRICFECQMIVFGDEPQPKEKKDDDFSDDERAPRADVDPIHLHLVKLAKELFPKDEVMQKLK